jgi:hypothetical protein
MGSRLRHAGYKAKGVHVGLWYRDGSFWHKGTSLESEVFDSRDIYKKTFGLLCNSPYRKPVRELNVACFNLMDRRELQLGLFEDVEKKASLVASMDKVNERWGDFIITPARMLPARNAVPDRIAFGGVKELEEFTLV